LLAVSTGPSGDIHLARGDTEGALEAFERALSIDEAASSRAPDRADYRRLRAITLIRLANANVSQAAYARATSGMTKPQKFSRR
jgi:tetratricopeptide (TPR) repeat protein